jgi:hypothetical protein
MKWKYALLVLSFTCVMALLTHSAHSQTLYVTKGGYAATLSKEVLNRVLDLSIEKDYVALQQLIDAGLVITLKPGIEVYLVKAGFLGRIQIRPRGSNLVLWTVSEAITRQGS